MNYQVADNLLVQLKQMKAHGFPMLGMIGASEFVALEGEGGIQFSVKSPNRKVNKVVIKYDAGQDLYNLELWYIKIASGKMNKNYALGGIGVEQLYEILLSHIVDGKKFGEQK